MIQNSMTMGVAGVVSLVSMLVVFAVLLLLYGIVIIFGKVLSGTAKTSASPAAPSASPAAAPKQDDSELIAVLSAAIADYEQNQTNPFIRNRQDLG